MQLPLSIVFTRFMNLFSALLPEPKGFLPQLTVLIAAIVLTGIGAAMSLNMRVIPNPGDGIVQAIADFAASRSGSRRIALISSTSALPPSYAWLPATRCSASASARWLAVLGVGRVIALFNHLFMKKMDALAGLER